MLPRTAGTVAIGATVEERGFDKALDRALIGQLRRNAEVLFPAFKDAAEVETWSGLRPGTPDKLPILGATSVGGYFVATGHYRSGILLAPITAKVMALLITSGRCDTDLAPFSPSRFS
jgi:glycine oxidase